MSLKCAREVLNFSTVSKEDRFDNPSYDPDKFLKKINSMSPKMSVLLQNIRDIDKKDFILTGKLYKHFIFTDIRGSSGIKILISGLIAAGYDFIIDPKGGIDQDKVKKENPSKFAALSSTALWKKPMPRKTIKDVLKTFNNRETNVYGDDVRIIILDNGFKEGIDLLDVKYVHIFEEPLTEADETQAIGRALRFCGQKGLPFGIINGWEIVVTFYISGDGESFVKKIQSTDKDTVVKNNFISDITLAMNLGAFDKDLNHEVNNFENTRVKIMKKIGVAAAGAAAAIGLSAFVINKKIKTK